MTSRTRLTIALLLIAALYASCASRPADETTSSSSWDSMVWDQSNWK